MIGFIQRQRLLQCIACSSEMLKAEPATLHRYPGIRRWRQHGGQLELVAEFPTIRRFVSQWEYQHPWNQAQGRVADALFSSVNSKVTPITLAALGGWSAAVTAFADLGVSPNVGRQCGARAVTPLMVALMQGQLALASKLADAGAALDGEDDGISPLSMSIQVAKGLFGKGMASFEIELVPEVVASRLGNFALKEVKSLIKEELMDDAGQDVLDELSE